MTMNCSNTTRGLIWALVIALLPLPAAAGPGQKMYQAFLENGGLYDDSEWQSYVDEIGQRLLAVSQDAKKEYHFYVVDDTSVNAFALPDGYIFLHRGLIAYMRSEDELAGVIGHEIGHVVGSHAKRANILSGLGSIAGLVGSFMTGTGSIADLSNTATAAFLKSFVAEARASGLVAEAIKRHGIAGKLQVATSE